MLFVMTLKWQPGLTREQRDGTLMRRAQWNYPDGVKLHGEYWPTSENLAVVSVFETDDQAALLEIGFTWGDAFQIEVTPAVSAEDGLRIGPEVLGRRQI
jgi:Protein of unknown function (DUF3303)